MLMTNSLNSSVAYLHFQPAFQDKFLTVSPTDQSVGPEAGRVSFIISSNTEWTVSDDSEWITIGCTTGGTGNGTLTLLFSANNTNLPRTGTITIIGNDVDVISVTITQAGITSLSVAPGNQNVGSESGNIVFVIDTNTDWAISWTANWITVNPSDGSGSTEVSVTYGENNTNNDRIDTLTISANGLNPYYIVFTQSKTTNSDTPDHSEFSVSPNPFDNYILIKAEGCEHNRLSVYILDISGKILYKNNNLYPVPVSEILLEVGFLKNGIYFFVIKQRNELKTFKMVRQ